MENLLGKMQELLSDPESMKQISELAQMFQSGEAGSSSDTNPASAPEANPIPEFDANLLFKAGELLRQQEHDKNTDLLIALRPHLRPYRQERLDKAVRMLKLWHLWKQLQASGMLHNLL